MASYGVFQAVCGFNCHGPRGHLEFAPALRRDDFRAAFTSAAGWGTLSQVRAEQSQTNTVARQARSTATENAKRCRGATGTDGGSGQLGDAPLDAKFEIEIGWRQIELAEEVVLSEGQELKVVLS